jgi:hypothetical protein
MMPRGNGISVYIENRKMSQGDQATCLRTAILITRQSQNRKKISTRLPNGTMREEAIDETHLIDNEKAEGQTNYS